MTKTIARWVLSGAACCMGQAAGAAERLDFWPSGGEHGIDACVFTTTMSADDPKGFGRFIVGVAADTATLAPVGTVKLRHDDPAAIPRRLALGAGTDTLLDVPLRPTGAHTVRAGCRPRRRKT